MGRNGSNETYAGYAKTHRSLDRSQRQLVLLVRRRNGPTLPSEGREIRRRSATDGSGLFRKEDR
jgi:hypothetical protein